MKKNNFKILKFWQTYPLEIIIYFFFIFLSIFLSFYHEPWLDEAQAWLISKDNNIWGMIKTMSYEGSPALWHFLIFPFTKLFPFWVIQIIHKFFILGAILLLLFKSPFKKWQKKSC